MKCIRTENGWNNTIIEEVVRTGGHDSLDISDRDFVECIRILLIKIGLNLGINTAIGYENSSLEDMILNLHTISNNTELLSKKKEK